MRTIAVLATLLLIGFAIVGWHERTDPSPATGDPDCRPIDGAWAVAIRLVDAVTSKPVTDAVGMTWSTLDAAPSDSAGWLCIRVLPPGADSVEVSRPGYRSTILTVAGQRGELLIREVRMQRVPDPCCDLRGRWRITFNLDSASEFGPRPTSRSASGELALGPGILAPEVGDVVDSLVRTVRGLHEVDFHPFFGGPVAWSMSTSVFGDGPDLMREVMGRVPSGDSVSITFIPRMSHGSLSLSGRIRRDTIRGSWIQNAYCCGARGRFVMVRVGPVDSTPFPEPAIASYDTRRRPAGPPPILTPAGEIPGGRWRPELEVAPDGRIWLARGGLFVADSLFAPWHRVLGGQADPVDADELRLDVRLAFADAQTVLLGLRSRYLLQDAPTLYRTVDAGTTWSSLELPSVEDIRALSAVGHSIWLAGSREDGRIVLLESIDGGLTWSELASPTLSDTVGGPTLHRASDSVAYLSAHTDPGEVGLWRTEDRGRQWSALPTPSDQGLQQLNKWETRIEEMATVGSWILVREHGRVFVSPADEVRWRALPDVRHVASELGGRHAFILFQSLRPALLNEDLAVVWEGGEPLQVRDPGSVEQVLLRNGAGFVSETRGAVHEIRNGTVRVLGQVESPP